MTFIEAIRLAQEEILTEHPDAFIIGEGVLDPKGVFGTTVGLSEKFPGRIFDSPVSENGVAGVCIGAAIAGMKPIMTFQRIDFALYAMDQIINNAAKWRSMFGTDRPLSFVMRMTVGRGWGQGNQHSQNLEALFAHIPGLRVVVPHSPESAHRLLKEAVLAPDPTVFIEHRWLHNFSDQEYPKPQCAERLTVVAWGHAAVLAKQTGIGDVVVLEQLNPLKAGWVFFSAGRTSKVLIVSDDWKSCGVAAEIVARLHEYDPDIRVKRLTCPDQYIPSSHFESNGFYPDENAIRCTAGEMLGVNFPTVAECRAHDVDPYSQKATTGI